MTGKKTSRLTGVIFAPSHSHEGGGACASGRHRHRVLNDTSRAMKPAAFLVSSCLVAIFTWIPVRAQDSPAGMSAPPPGTSSGYRSEPLNFFHAFNKHGARPSGTPVRLVFVHTPDQPVYMRSPGGRFVPIPVRAREIMAPIVYPWNRVTVYGKTRGVDQDSTFRPLFGFSLPAGIRQPLAAIVYSPGARTFIARFVEVSPSAFRPGDLRVFNASGSRIEVLLDSRRLTLPPGGTAAAGPAHGKRVPVKIVAPSGSSGRFRTLHHSSHKTNSKRRTLLMVYPSGVSGRHSTAHLRVLRHRM